MDAESWYDMIKMVKTSQIIEIKDRFTLSNFIPWIEDGADLDLLTFKTRDEAEQFVNTYYPNISIEEIEAALREIQASYSVKNNITK